MLIKISIQIRIFIEEDLDISMAVDRFLVIYNAKMKHKTEKLQGCYTIHKFLIKHE